MTTYSVIVISWTQCICLPFTIYLGVESHMECIKLSLQLSDLITVVHQ